MSATDFSSHDVRFRRTGEDECKIVVHGETVGAVHRHTSHSQAEHPFDYAIHLYDASGAPRLVDRRSQIRLAVADWLWTANLVPVLFDPMLAPPAPTSRASAS